MNVAGPFFCWWKIWEVCFWTRLLQTLNVCILLYFSLLINVSRLPGIQRLTNRWSVNTDKPVKGKLVRVAGVKWSEPNTWNVSLKFLFYDIFMKWFHKVLQHKSQPREPKLLTLRPSVILEVNFIAGWGIPQTLKVLWITAFISFIACKH